MQLLAPQVGRVTVPAALLGGPGPSHSTDLRFGTEVPGSGEGEALPRPVFPGGDRLGAGRGPPSQGRGRGVAPQAPSLCRPVCGRALPVRGPAPECPQGSAAPCARPSPKSPLPPHPGPKRNKHPECLWRCAFLGGREGWRGAARYIGALGEGPGHPLLPVWAGVGPGRTQPRLRGREVAQDGPQPQLWDFSTTARTQTPKPPDWGRHEGGIRTTRGARPRLSGHRRGTWPSGSSQAAAPVSVCGFHPQAPLQVPQFPGP
nr:translation initiation factor IF-2-like [Symphalangus syndactylus]